MNYLLFLIFFSKSVLPLSFFKKTLLEMKVHMVVVEFLERVKVEKLSGGLGMDH